MRRTHEKLFAGMLLNAFVMPGAGHVAVGIRLRGLAIASAAMFFLFLPLLRFALALREALETNLGGAGVGAVRRATEALSVAWEKEGSLVLWCLVALAAIWIFSILDLARLKRKP